MDIDQDPPKHENNCRDLVLVPSSLKRKELLTTSKKNWTKMQSRLEGFPHAYKWTIRICKVCEMLMLENPRCAIRYEASGKPLLSKCNWKLS